MLSKVCGESFESVETSVKGGLRCASFKCGALSDGCVDVMSGDYKGCVQLKPGDAAGGGCLELPAEV